MQDTNIVLEFIKLFQDAPSYIVLVAFLGWMLKKYVINGTAGAVREYLTKRVELEEKKVKYEAVQCRLLQAISEKLEIMQEDLAEQIKTVNEIAASVGRRQTDS